MADASANSGVALSVVIPCYDEENRLPATLGRVREFLSARGGDWELLIVDDGSRDQTLTVAREFARDEPRVRVLCYGSNRGKGYAVRHGALASRGNLVLFTDADLSTPIEELDAFIRAMDAGVDGVIGSRSLPDSRIEIHQPWWRELAGRLMNLLIRCVSGLSYCDTQCGFKLFSGPIARQLFAMMTVERWMFDVELLFLAKRLGYRVVDRPVVWRNSGDSRVRFRHLPNVFRELMHIRTYWLFRKPDRPTAGVPRPLDTPPL